MTPFMLTEKQRAAQKVLAGDARHVLLRGGSRSGKTFLLVRTVIARALAAPNSRHAIFRRYLNSARASLWKGTLREVLRTCWPGLLEQCDTNEAEMVLALPNGATVLIAGLDDDQRVEKVLGLEFVTIYLNESSEISWGSVSTVLTRLSQKVAKLDGALMRPKLFADMNPTTTKHWSFDLFIRRVKPGTTEPLGRPENYAEFHLNPADNAENIDADYLKSLAELSAKDRRRFLLGEWTNEVDGALFSMENIDANRVGETPELIRVLVSVDPPVTSGDRADECGIIVSGFCAEGHAYILADASCKGLTPEGWARRAIEVGREYHADRWIAEVNNGGELVEAVLRQIDPTISYKAVRASRGKVARAEPVSALYEQGKVHHVGEFAELESQLCALVPGFDPRRSGYSPDRADALVWAITELMLSKGGGMALARVTGL